MGKTLDLFNSSYAEARDACWKAISDEVVEQVRFSLWNPVTDSIWEIIVHTIEKELEESII